MAESRFQLRQADRADLVAVTEALAEVRPPPPAYTQFDGGDQSPPAYSFREPSLHERNEFMPRHQNIPLDLDENAWQIHEEWFPASI